MTISEQFGYMSLIQASTALCVARSDDEPLASDAKRSSRGRGMHG
jgi:hypothetical protein